MDEHPSGDVMRAYRVYGRVQGVGFRWWTCRLGSELGLGGHVGNVSDGSVEVHAVGPEDVLARLERALHRGPPVARVDRLERVEPDESMPKHEFRIELS